MNALVELARPWDGWGHMWGTGWGWLWSSLMILVWVGLIALVVWLVARAVTGSGPAAPPAPPPRPTGLERARDILSERYARGEISTEEYQDRLSHLGSAR
jgi:putative membrane protein